MNIMSGKILKEEKTVVAVDSRT